MYKVIKRFSDLQDGRHQYNPGDIFPRVGADASPERLEELSGSNNRQHTPLIEYVPEKKPRKARTVTNE